MLVNIIMKKDGVHRHFRSSGGGVFEDEHKMKNIKAHTVGTVPTYNRQIVETETTTIYTYVANTCIHDFCS
jgi:hypothetical protein